MRRVSNLVAVLVSSLGLSCAYIERILPAHVPTQEEALQTAQDYISSPSGQTDFRGATAEEPVAVYDSEVKKIRYWKVPVRKGGLYVSVFDITAVGKGPSSWSLISPASAKWAVHPYEEVLELAKRQTQTAGPYKDAELEGVLVMSNITGQWWVARYRRAGKPVVVDGRDWGLLRNVLGAVLSRHSGIATITIICGLHCRPVVR